jgi:CDGSH-type Zn-finger protein
VDFITSNAAPEFYGYLMSKTPEVLAQASVNPQAATNFFRSLGGYLDALPEEIRKSLLYGSLATADKPFVIQQIADLIRQGNLFDEAHIYTLLKHAEFGVNKRGLMAVTSDKAYYNEPDIATLENLTTYISEHFPERGERTTKQGFLSSKQKPVWKCGCGKTNENTYCSGCQHDIYGFTHSELSPLTALSYLRDKIEAIKLHLNGSE